MNTERPRPVPDLQTEPYWQGLLRKALLVQVCPACSVRIHPSLPCCPDCLETELSWVEVIGAGVVVGYCAVAQPFVPGLATPYVVVRVALSDAPRVELIANLIGAGRNRPAIGAAVQVVYEVVDEGLVLAQFDLVGPAA